MVGARDVVDARTIAERARWAESIGITHVAVHDHLSSQLAPMTVLTAVAAATDRLRLCPLVFNNDLRHPAVLAQELASLDVVSGGRVEVGIGAGWNEPEYRATGIRFDPPGTRIERMIEAIAILRGLFADGPFRFAGRHYTITDMEGQPKPVQRPHPPFLIGGTRERVLRLAAREADIVGLDLRQRGDAILDAFEARTDVRIGWIREEAGERIDQLDLNVLRAVGDIAQGGRRGGASAERVDRHADHPARRPRIAVLADRQRSRPGRQARPDAPALGHQLIPDRLVRRADPSRPGPSRGATRGGVGPSEGGRAASPVPGRSAGDG
jgi:probable F420-dependent oxidoreductase